MISIHAPCTGSDLMAFDIETTRLISIHAPCTGSDITETGAKYHSYDFNPRSLHGERLERCLYVIDELLFQSTLPARGATLLTEYNTVTGLISIHAPCTGSDDKVFQQIANLTDFNPRSLHGERPN